MRRRGRIMCAAMAAVLLLTCVLCAIVPVRAESAENTVSIELQGSGTKTDPYQVNTLDDLCAFRDCVNQGTTFAGCYVCQNANIDMDGEDWYPIGAGNHCFYGVYDGRGHFVENLYIPFSDRGDNNNGFFENLGGTVVNFGIESGYVEGNYCGSIASRAKGSNAAILNCYSKAEVRGIRAGGIADNFSGNVIAGCWFDGELDGIRAAALLTSGGDVKVYHAYTTTGAVTATSDVNTSTSAAISEETLYSESFVQKLNLSAGMTQCLFAEGRGASVMQWELDKSGNVTFSTQNGYLHLFEFINLYLLPLLLLIVAVGYCAAFRRVGRKGIWNRYHKDIKAIAVISGVISAFVDSAVAGKGLSCLNSGNGAFIAMINAIFLGTLILCVKNSGGRPRFRKSMIPIFCAVAAILVLEMTQFGLVPRYDAHLYYGSFVKAADLFQVDFLTYIGAFVCWKWAQGLALLLAPLEFLLPGQMIGVYIANMCITAITMGCFYWLFRQISPAITPLLAAFGSAILVLCPYELGMFTYLCMDSHTAYFLVWLLCSYKKKNPLLVAFCGYLLAFNKVTGLVFYVFFLMAMALLEVISDKGKPLFRRIRDWWDWKTVILWVAPAAIYAASVVMADDLTIQCFYGSYSGATIGLKSLRGLANTFMQSYVYGFRWLFMLFLVAAVILFLMKRRKISEIYTTEGVQMLLAAAVGCLGVLLCLCIYRGDAECPRYTAMFNVFYALSFPLAVQALFRKQVLRHAAGGGMALLLLVQTYWTIDPAIFLTSESIDTGKTQLYKLALPGDPRVAMKLGTDYGPGIEVPGDLYAYNLEYSFYDGLLDEMLTDISPDEETQFVLLDVINYELHLYGNHYKIYWNTRTEHRTYDSKDPDSIFLENERDVTTQQICSGQARLDSHFYLLVPARVDASLAISALEADGYELTYESMPENLYGELFVYGFTLSPQ